MGTGLKYNNVSPIDGESFQDAWNVSAAVAQNLSVLRLQDDRGEKALVWYYGTAAIATTLTALAQAPKGTIVFDMQAHTTVEKTGAAGTSAWVTSAARA